MPESAYLFGESGSSPLRMGYRQDGLEERLGNKRVEGGVF